MSDYMLTSMKTKTVPAISYLYFFILLIKDQEINQ